MSGIFHIAAPPPPPPRPPPPQPPAQTAVVVVVVVVWVTGFYFSSNIPFPVLQVLPQRDAPYTPSLPCLPPTVALRQCHAHPNTLRGTINGVELGNQRTYASVESQTPTSLTHRRWGQAADVLLASYPPSLHPPHLPRRRDILPHALPVLSAPSEGLQGGEEARVKVEKRS